LPSQWQVTFYWCAKTQITYTMVTSLGRDTMSRHCPVKPALRAFNRRTGPPQFPVSRLPSTFCPTVSFISMALASLIRRLLPDLFFSSSSSANLPQNRQCNLNQIEAVITCGLLFYHQGWMKYYFCWRNVLQYKMLKCYFVYSQNVVLLI
jgi:hypothetical protein